MEKLTELLSDIFQIPIDQIKEATNIKELESWDSLKHMELIAAIEGDYGVSLTVDEIIAMTSIETIQNIIDSKN